MAYPAVWREGLDADVILALQQLDGILSKMRDGKLLSFAVTDEVSAVGSYLIYNTMLVDVALSAIASSAIHGMDLIVIMLQRSLVEYAAKAAYFADHPSYALYEMTIGSGERIHKKFAEGSDDKSEVARSEQHLEGLRTLYQRVAHLRKLPFSEIFAPYAGRDDYVGLYSMPSGLLHGDPEGIQFIVSTDSSGAPSASLQRSVEEINARLVDAGANALVSYRAFGVHFFPGDVTLLRSADELDSTFRRLGAKHSWGRKVDPLRFDDENEE